jgi:hypothetical protein
VNRLEQPLRVAMQFNNVLLVRLGQQPFERLFRTLPCVDHVHDGRHAAPDFICA